MRTSCSRVSAASSRIGLPIRTSVLPRYRPKRGSRYATFRSSLRRGTLPAVNSSIVTIEAQRAGCRSAALVKRGDETILAGDLRRHLVIGHDRHPRFERGTLRTARPASTDCPQAGERFLSIHVSVHQSYSLNFGHYSGRSRRGLCGLGRDSGGSARRMIS
jgi:hypothetical protein